MDQQTKLATLRTLAKAAAEIAADIATTTSEAAGDQNGVDLPGIRANQIVGAIMPAEAALEQITAIFSAMRAVHRAAVEPA